jgi:hypothetical protein
MDLKCFQSAKVVGLKDVEISLKGSKIVEVMCANDANIGLNNFGIVDVVQVNLFSRLTFVKGQKASFELLFVA